MGRKKITQEDFFNRVRNPNYDFSNTNFIDLNTPIEVVCIFHGLFLFSLLVSEMHSEFLTPF